jgi:hypothetical protein
MSLFSQRLQRIIMELHNFTAHSNIDETLVNKTGNDACDAL